MKYRKKPEVVEAIQWWQSGDHPSVMSVPDAYSYHVRRHCQYCNKSILPVHGWLENERATYVVCPGDYIITNDAGKQYPCKPDPFEATYDPVAD